jgi:hypothetical protein
VIRLLRFLLCVLGALLVAAPAAAATYTLAPSQDTDVRQNGGGVSNCGACTQLSVRNHSTGEYRPLYQFDLTGVPAGARVVSATLRLWVTGAENSSVGVYRVTQSWSEGTLTWANSGGVAHDPTAIASFTPAATGRYYDINIASLVALWRAGTTNNGLILKIGGGNTLATFTSKEWATSSQRPQLVIVADPPPSFATAMSHPLVSDPYNGATNPKAIPGAVLTYSVSVSNSSAGYPDSDSVAVVQSVPAQSSLYVRDLGAAGSGPVAFAQGTPPSGLTYTFTSLASATDDVAFSSNGGVSFGYAPTPDASGFDAAVTHIRVTPRGIFAGSTGSGSPSFTISYRVKVK